MSWRTIQIKKVGLIWDAFSAHSGPKVKAFLDKHKERLFAVGIKGGLTSVIQVYDLVANKNLKRLIRKRYYKWRTDHLKEKRAALVSMGLDINTRIKIKIPIDDMASLVEAAFDEFNVQERSCATIRKTF